MATVGLVSGLAGCGGGGGGTPGATYTLPDNQVNISATTSTYSIQFVDAVSGQPITTEDISVTLAAPNGVTLNGPPDSSGNLQPAPTVVKNGVLKVYADFKDPSKSFTVTPVGNTWVAQAHEVKATDDKNLVVKLLRNVTADSTTYVTKIGGGDAKTGDVTVTASTTLGTAQITIKQDDTLGQLSIAVVKFADDKANALDQALSQGTFALADNIGMARFIVTDSTGKTIKDFPKGLKLKMQLAPSAKADASIVVGQKYPYPIRSFDEDSGAWTEENPTDATVIEEGGNRFVEFTAYHLTLWSLYDPAVAYCATPSSITLTGRPGSNTEDLTFRIVSTGANSTFDKTKSGVTDSILSLSWVPKDFNVNVTATKTGTATVVGTLTNINLCTQSPFTMTLSNMTPVVKATLTVKVTESCIENSAIKQAGINIPVDFAPNATVMRYLGGTTADPSGQITINQMKNQFNLPVDLTVGTSGQVRIWNRFTKDYFTAPIDINSPSVSYEKDFNGLVCNPVTGTGSQNP